MKFEDESSPLSVHPDTIMLFNDLITTEDDCRPGSMLSLPNNQHSKLQYMTPIKKELSSLGQGYGFYISVRNPSCLLGSDGKWCGNPELELERRSLTIAVWIMQAVS